MKLRRVFAILAVYLASPACTLPDPYGDDESFCEHEDHGQWVVDDAGGCGGSPKGHCDTGRRGTSVDYPGVPLGPPPECSLDDDCKDARARCSAGKCSTEHPRCLHDDECGPALRCVLGQCSCATDEACPSGAACKAAVKGRVLCETLVDSAWEPIGCAADGGCPAPLSCDSLSRICESNSDARFCGPTEPCPSSMVCGADGVCHEDASRDGGAAIDASGADAPNAEDGATVGDSDAKPDADGG